MKPAVHFAIAAAVLSVAPMASPTVVAQVAAAPSSWADYLPGCRQRAEGNGYDPERWCQDRWEKVQASQPLVETIYQALQLAAKGVPDAEIAGSLAHVAWEPPARAGAPRQGRIGADLGVRLPAMDWEGRPRPRSLEFAWPVSYDGSGAFQRFVWELAEALRARGDTLERIGCWYGGGSGVKVYRVTSRDSGNRPFALEFHEDDGRAGFSTEIRVALDGNIPTGRELQAQAEGFHSCM